MKDIFLGFTVMFLLGLACAYAILHVLKFKDRVGKANLRWYKKIFGWFAYLWFSFVGSLIGFVLVSIFYYLTLPSMELSVLLSDSEFILRTLAQFVGIYFAFAFVIIYLRHKKRKQHISTTQIQ